MRTLFFTLLISTLLGCQNEISRSTQDQSIKYDVIVVIGQSNVYNGYGLDTLLDKTDNRIKQLGRFGTNNYKIIPAKDPLEHHTIAEKCNGFAMTFAFQYLQNYWQGDREVLLIPGALNGSSFYQYQWQKNDTLYNDVVKRIEYVLKTYPGSEVKAFLWHQGEGDITWGRYYAQLLDKMITNMRSDVGGVNGNSIPFIVGGMVPYWVDKRTDRKIVDSVIAETPLRLTRVGYASARLPFVITKTDNDFEDIHFDAAGQRELGRRYFNVYRRFRP